MALTAALAVPAAAGTGAVSQPVTNNSGQIPAKIHTATQAAVDHAAGAATALADVPGYAGVAVDYDDALLTISWKGDAPAAVSTLELPDGVTLDVRRTTLSEVDLRAASTRLLDSQRGENSSATVLAALPTEDYAGLVVEVSEDSVRGASANDLARRMQRVAGVPVRIKVVANHVESTSGSRRDDGQAWHAGGAIAEADGTDYCTTGFSIVTETKQRRIVTAAHCSTKIGSLVLDGAGQPLGTVTHRAPSLDAQLIRPDGDTTTAGAVFGGPWNATPAHARYEFPVAAVQRPAVGQNICGSGAVTGEHCATIRATDIAWTCGKRTCHGFRASRDDNGVVVGGGDSGGPMYTVIDGKAYARGLIDGGSNPHDCGTTSVSTQCFSYVYGIPMVDILDHWNASIDK